MFLLFGAQCGRESAKATFSYKCFSTLKRFRHTLELEEERHKATAAQLRVEEEAARIQPLHHGHHRTAKQFKLELPCPGEAATKKKNEKNCRGSSEKPRAAGTTATKTRKRA